MSSQLLAIDDDPALLDLIQKVGESSGVTVNATTDPALFKEIVRKGTPDLVLLDLQMPDSDGVELLRFLADEKCTARIVLMSGFDTRLLDLAHTLGAELKLNMGDSVRKPFHVVALRKLLGDFKSRDFKPDAASLSQALADDQLALYYQPIVRLNDGGTVGFEGLVRWNHPEYGLIMPDRFIGLAEREGLIHALTDRVVDLGVRQLGVWRSEGLDASISLNLSVANIVDARLPDYMFQLCAHHGVAPTQICLELTETVAMANPVQMLEILSRLRLKGFQLAIDDFGTGYSSLLQLYRLPFSKLKVDQSFVRKMAQSEEANLIVGAIVGLARSLNLSAIAEGVENEDIRQRLLAHGCEIGQGYHFGRPMPASQVLDWTQKKN